MNSYPHFSVEIINNAAQLGAVIKKINRAVCLALDTESNSRYHYPEQLCLVQIATPEHLFIIDTIMLPDISLLKEALENPGIRKIIHGADYDLRCLDRHLGLHINNLYDTSMAARFAGINEFGLAALIKNILGIDIVKSERLQRSDWGRRPLSAEAVEYAAGDVRHLIALGTILEQRIRDLERTTWVSEENARLEEIRFTAADTEKAFLSIKGSQDLDGRGLAVLRSLYLFREEEALRQGRPPFFVIPDYALVTLAMNPQVDLQHVSGLGPVGLKRFGPGLKQALRDGQCAPPVRRPIQNNGRLSPEQASRLSRLKTWRTSQSAALALDPSLIWPMVSLERLARLPESLEIESSTPPVRDWQRRQFGSSLLAFLNCQP